MQRVVLLTLTTILFVLTLAGCGGGDEQAAQEREEETTATKEQETTAAETTEPIEVIEVVETEYALDPADITLEQPGTYVFRAVNVGNATHALEIEGQGIEEETENLQPGESTELTVALEPGTYEIYCPVSNHRELGMDGSVTVLEG
jgi:uncharacterized cupredoxin-like copper-binding protein